MSEPFEEVKFKRAFLGGLRVGMYLDEVCKLVMIDPREFARWRKAALEGHEPFRQFIHECDKAEAEMIRRSLGAIQRHSRKDWHAGMELMKRRHGAHWNRSYDAVDGEQQRKLDELDLSPAGVQSSLDELDAIDGRGNVVAFRRTSNSPQKPGRVRQGGDVGDDGAVRPGSLAEAAGGGTDGGGGGA